MHNILVTGANGQLGQCLSDELLYKKDGNNWFFKNRNQLDITDEGAIERFVASNSIDIIINCAAYTNVNGAETDYDNAYNINALGVKYLANTCKKHNATLIHISTDYVFNGWVNTPYYPDDLAMPMNVYGQTKFDGENFIRYSGCKSIVIRTSWLYSQYGDNFVKKMIKKFKNNEDVSVVCDQTGSPTLAIDLARFIYCIIDTNKIDNFGIYHFANKGSCSWYDFAHEIHKYYEEDSNSAVIPCRTEDFPSPVVRPPYSVLDSRMTENIFNFEIPHWTDSLKDLIQTL